MPRGTLECRALPLPEVEAITMDAHNQAHPFRLCIEAPVLEEPPHVVRRIVNGNVQPHQAVSGVAERAITEAAILGKKGDPPKPVQHRNNL